jgi:hypothetical protein
VTTDILNFGSFASIRSDEQEVAISAYKEPTAVTTYKDAGSVYTFSKTNGQWIQDQKLVADDAARFDHFGEALTYLNDDVLMIGM